jgi:hypothetical protein
MEPGGVAILRTSIRVCEGAVSPLCPLRERDPLNGRLGSLLAWVPPTIHASA